MRVCLVTSSPLPPEEGIGFYVWNLTQKLLRKGHIVHIITRGPLGRGTREALAEVTIWRPAFAPLYPFHVHIHSLFVNRLIAHLEEQVDVFHVHSPLPPMLRTTRPVLLTVHTPMRADARGLALRSGHALLIKMQMPVSCSIERRLLRSAAQVTTVAHSVADELREYGVVPSNVMVLANGVDHERFSPNGVDPSEPPYILAVGRLEQRKGFEDLLKCARLVCREHPGVQFWIAGKGHMGGMLATAIQRSGLQGRVILLGHVVDRNRMIELYRGATLFVHPAHREGLPTVMLEAMACGLPIVATAVSGALDVVTTGENGLLVPPQEPMRMAEAIELLLTNAPLRARLGWAARRTIEARFSWDIVSDNYIEIYSRLLAEQRKTS